MAFEGKLKDAITAAKGRSAKAISALLDMDALRKSSNQDTDIKAALEALKKDSGYLFDEGDPTPPYAPGTGKSNISGKYSKEEAAIRTAAGLTID